MERERGKREGEEEFYFLAKFRKSSASSGPIRG